MRKQFIFGWGLLEIKQSFCLYTVEGHLTLKRDMMSESCPFMQLYNFHTCTNQRSKVLNKGCGLSFRKYFGKLAIYL